MDIFIKKIVLLKSYLIGHFHYLKKYTRVKVISTQLAFTCTKSTMGTPGQYVKSVQCQQ